MININDIKIAVIGLGYVGLPLAVEFGKQHAVVGFDINAERIAALNGGTDHTLEVSDEELAQATHLCYSANIDALKDCNFFIVTVPTPIDAYKQPDLTPLIKASEAIGSLLKQNDIVVYESTVYPGATEEVCIPVLESVSGLVFNKDFYAGYSPERINPGDKEHRVTNILKVTAGSTPEVADFVDDVYNLIITAGTHKASSIKVAEAAKVIENTQRDVNIAVYNVAVGGRTTLNTLFTALQEQLAVNGVSYAQDAVYRDFRAGDVRHSQADINKIQNALGYVPQFDIVKAMPWYVKSLKK